MFRHCDEYGILYKDLVALGSDGTGLVTGYRVGSEKLSKAANIHNIILSSPCHGEQFLHYLQSGEMSEVQKMLDRPLQIVICLLHHVELPLRHLFMFIDGSSASMCILKLLT